MKKMITLVYMMAFVLFLSPSAHVSAQKTNSLKLNKVWQEELSKDQTDMWASCYGTIKVDNDNLIWVVVNYDYMMEILYQVDADGKIQQTVTMPYDSLSSTDCLSLDAQKNLYAAGNSKEEDTIRVMAVIKMDVNRDTVLWRRCIPGSSSGSAPMACTLSVSEDGYVLATYKHDEESGLGLAVFDLDGNLIKDTLYDVGDSKCIARSAALTQDRLVVIGETFSFKGFICSIKLSDLSLEWQDFDPAYMTATQAVLEDNGRYISGGSGNMVGISGLNMHDNTGKFISSESAPQFVCGFGLQKSSEGFFLMGGSMGVNPFAEYTSVPVVSIFNNEGKFAGLYTDGGWENTDTYICASTSLQDGSFIAVLASTVGYDVPKIYLAKFSTETIEKESQEIEWNQEFTTLYHDEEIKLEASASSGLDVSFFTSDSYGELYIENGTLKVRPSFAENSEEYPDGVEFEIYAYQNGNDSYMPAPYVIKKVVVKVRPEETANETAEESPIPMVYNASLKCISFPRLQEKTQVHIYDVNGRKVKSATLSGEGASLSVKDLVSGIYIVKVEQDSIFATHKIVIL